MMAINNIPAEQNDDRIRLSGNESQQEDIANTTAVALEHCFAQRAIAMQRDLSMLGAH